MFQGALIESLPVRTPRSPVLIPLVLLAHAVLIGALLGASAWSSGEPPEPPLRISFSVAPVPPAGGPPAGTPHHATTTSRRDPPSVPVLAELPVLLETEVPSESAAGGGPSAPGEEGRGSTDAGEGEGDGAGPGEGIGGPGDVGATQRGQPLPVGGNVRAPQLIHRTDPTYSETARRLGLQGTVILQAVISASGQVEDVRVLRSVHPLLDASAVGAVERWKYRPATLNGRAVRVYLTITAAFRLH